MSGLTSDLVQVRFVGSVGLFFDGGSVIVERSDGKPLQQIGDAAFMIGVMMRNEHCTPGV